MRDLRTVLGVAGATALLVGLLPVGARPSVAAEVVNHDYVGAERCRACHAEAFDVWARGPHARAMDSLRENERRDARCTQCHTMVPSDPDVRLAGIQCETCHGPGRYYAKDHVMRDAELRARLAYLVPDEKTCRSCHTDNTPSLRPFDYRAARERIRHWPVERDAPTPPASDG